MNMFYFAQLSDRTCADYCREDIYCGLTARQRTWGSPPLNEVQCAN